MIRYELFAARDGDTVNEHIDIEPSGSDLIDESRAEDRAFAAICKTFRLSENAYEDWNDLVADLDGSTLRRLESEPVADLPLTLHPIPATGREQVAEAIECLKRARDLFKASGNKQTLARVRLALSSAKGAARIQASRAVRQVLDEQQQREEAELRDAHVGQGNGGSFADWVRDMADNNGGTLQDSARRYLLRTEG